MLLETKAESSSGTQLVLNYVKTGQTIQTFKWATHNTQTNTAEQNG